MRTTMRAVVITGAGPQRFELADVPVPANGPDEILVRVGAVGVGIHDSYFLPTGISMPFPIGIEAAGVIERVGTDVTHRHRPGDRIRLELERVYPFDEALTALHKVQTRHARGKVVLSLP